MVHDGPASWSIMDFGRISQVCGELGCAGLTGLRAAIIAFLVDESVMKNFK